MILIFRLSPARPNPSLKRSANVMHKGEVLSTFGDWEFLLNGNVQELRQLASEKHGVRSCNHASSLTLHSRGTAQKCAAPQFER